MTDCPDNRPFNTPSFCLRAMHTRMPPSSARPARLERTQAHHRSIYKPLSLIEGLYLREFDHGTKTNPGVFLLACMCVEFRSEKKKMEAAVLRDL